MRQQGEKLRNTKEVQNAPKEVFIGLKEIQIQKSQTAILQKLPTNYGLHLIARFRKSIMAKTRLFERKPIGNCSQRLKESKFALSIVINNPQKSEIAFDNL